MNDPDENLWARRPRGRHAELYDAEYAKQLERMARIRTEVSASLPDAAAREAARGSAPADVDAGRQHRGAPAHPRDSAAPAVPRGDGSRRQPCAAARPSPARWDAAPVDLGPRPLRAPVAPPVDPHVTARRAAAPVVDPHVPLRRAAAPVVDPHVTARRAAAPPIIDDGEAYDGGRRRIVVAATRNRLTSVAVAAALIVALAAGVAALVVARGEEPAAATVFRVPGAATGLVADRGRLWVAGPAAGEVWVLDQASGRPAVPPLRVGGTPARVVLDARFAWIADTERSSVVRAPKQGNGALRAVRTGPDLADLTVAAGRVWTASSADGTVRALDPNGRAEVLHVGVRPIALAGDAKRVVVLDAIGSLVRLDPATRREQGPPVQLGGRPVDVALAGDTAWVADVGGTVRAVTLSTGVAGPPIAVGRGPVAIAADANDVYVLCRGAKTLVRVSPDGGVRSRLVLQHAPTALALDPRHVWIAAGANEVIRVER